MTVSDLFDVAVAPPAAAHVEEKGGGTRARVHARVPATVSDDKVVVRTGGLRSTIIADFRSSWLWDAHGLTVRSLWAQRIPDIESAPGASQALRVGWVAYNHAALAVLVPLLFAAWLLGHPARLLYAAPIAVALLAIWLN